MEVSGCDRADGTAASDDLKPLASQRRHECLHRLAEPTRRPEVDGPLALFEKDACHGVVVSGSLFQHLLRQANNTDDLPLQFHTVSNNLSRRKPQKSNRVLALGMEIKHGRNNNSRPLVTVSITLLQQHGPNKKYPDPSVFIRARLCVCKQNWITRKALAVMLKLRSQEWYYWIATPGRHTLVNHSIKHGFNIIVKFTLNSTFMHLT